MRLRSRSLPSLPEPPRGELHQDVYDLVSRGAGGLLGPPRDDANQQRCAGLGRRTRVQRDAALAKHACVPLLERARDPVLDPLGQAIDDVVKAMPALEIE